MKALEKYKILYESHISPLMPKNIEATAILNALGFFRIPLLFAVSPKVLELSDRRAVIKIPLKRKTKNHLGSMYFGALAIGADSVVGALALHYMRKFPEENIQLSFKDFHAQFLKRPEYDVHFICDEGSTIADMVQKVVNTRERVSIPIPARAVVPQLNDEVVAQFTLTLSLKAK